MKFIAKCLTGAGESRPQEDSKCRLAFPPWSHKEANLARKKRLGEPLPDAQSVPVHFYLGAIAGISFGGLYVAATYFEPEPKEVSKPVPGVKIRR
jgi:hypothetical protein